MYDLVEAVLGASVPADLVSVVSSCILCLFFVVIFDMVYRIFSNFWK